MAIAAGVQVALVPVRWSGLWMLFSRGIERGCVQSEDEDEPTGVQTGSRQDFTLIVCVFQASDHIGAMTGTVANLACGMSLDCVPIVSQSVLGYNSGDFHHRFDPVPARALGAVEGQVGSANGAIEARFRLVQAGHADADGERGGALAEEPRGR